MTRTISAGLLALLLSLAPGCPKGTGGGGPDGGGTSDGGGGDLPAATYLELVPLDIWGRDHADATITLGLAPTAIDEVGAGPGVALIRVAEGHPFELPVRISAPDYFETTFTVSYDGTTSADAFSVTVPDGGARAVTGEDQRTIEATDGRVFSVFAGLDHRWFAASASPPSLNDVEVYLDGEEAWASVYEDLKTATRRVTWTTWFWESDFELWRSPDHPREIEAARYPYTVMGIVDSLPGVDWKVLINRFWGDNTDYAAYLNTDTALRDKAEAAGDGFDVILQGNPTAVPLGGQYFGQPTYFAFAPRVLENPRYAGRTLHQGELGSQQQPLTTDAASYHQKATVIDGQVAFVGGMNTKSTDWDSNEHLVFDARRMTFDATNAARMDVLTRNELPELGPRKDYMMRIAGPVARDVEEILWNRFELGLAAGDMFSENATAWALDPAAPEPNGGVLTQVVATLPEPFSQMQIRESHAKALAQAEHYIYIEDQYFRAPIFEQIIVQRMLEKPDLRLIVVTKEVGTLDGGLKFTYLGDALFRELFPDRYLVLVLKTADLYTEEGIFWDTVDLHLQNIDTHSKIRIIDDRFVSLGSCNYNNRGYMYEGEMNGSVLDDGLATAVRQRVFRNIAGPGWSRQLNGDPINDFEVLKAAAADNESIMNWWKDNVGDLDAPEAEAARLQSWPDGFAYPLTFSGDYLLEVGPDMF
ncbi:MAG: phospholipase D-like domain-containing protein [Deltaproteobacteria bacterium]|nr:phospholipase D-like domain-containing protein [Deltaproteobacteria bacterium]